MYYILDSIFISYDYAQWTAYFKKNDRHRLNIDFTNEPTLGEEEKALIFPSISAFQKGEHSEGSYLKSAALKFAEKNNEPDYPKAIEFFIKEENFHSSYLAQYMNYHNIPLKSGGHNGKLFDMIFRRLRRINGLHSEVTVLVTAEIIALSYYSALCNAAESKALKSICLQMLHDELPHIVFQSYTLGHFLTRPVNIFLRALLMEITCAAVWLAYRKVFAAGGYSFRRLLSESIGYLKQSVIIAAKNRG